MTVLFASTEDYSIEKPQQSVINLADKLNKIGVKDVSLRINCNLWGMEDAVTKTLSKLKSGDILLFYYCGHCTRADIRVNRQTTNPNGFYDNGSERFNFDESLKKIKDFTEKEKITTVFILDCIFPLPTTKRLEFRTEDLPLDSFMVWCDDSPEQGEETDDYLGRLTHSLIDLMGQKRDIEELMKMVRIKHQGDLTMKQVSSLICRVRL